MQTALGPVLTGLQLRRAILSQLETWMPSYVAELARAVDADQPPVGRDVPFAEIAVPPREYQRLPDDVIYDLAVDQSPSVIVSIGDIYDWGRDSDGLLSAIAQFSVTVIVRGDTFEQTSDLVALYLAAATLVILQQGAGLNGAGKARVLRQTARELDTDAARSIGGGQVACLVSIKDIASDVGDTLPDEPPPGPDFEFPPVVPADSTVNTNVDVWD